MSSSPAMPQPWTAYAGYACTARTLIKRVGCAAPRPDCTTSVIPTGLRRNAWASPGGWAAPKRSIMGMAASTVALENEVHKELRQRFGHNTFREGQMVVIQQLLRGESCAAVFPTGAGKSLCYQLPAQMLWEQGAGLTVVVSPLIALMKDQTDAMVARGVPCVKLDSTLEADEVSLTLAKIRGGKVALLYLAPERFNNERCLSALRAAKVALFVVDEAHCISEWGHNFRPDYLRLAAFADEIGVPTRLALTATATPAVAADMCSRLGIPEENMVRNPIRRPNLLLRASRAPDGFEERAVWLAQRMREAPPAPSVVYVTRQVTAEDLTLRLRDAGINARTYHGGMDTEEREEVQGWFMGAAVAGEGPPTVVATTAFGMGIDKGNIRYVYHFNLPRSVEEYSQGVGRAGRDGLPAHCLALLSPTDVPLLRAMVYAATLPPPAIRGLLSAVFNDGSGDESGEADVSVYDLSQQLDCKDMSVRAALAHLQTWGYLRELTSYYQSQQVSFEGQTADEILSKLPRSEVRETAAAVLRVADKSLASKSKIAKWADIDVRATALELGVPKLEVTRGLQFLASSGGVRLGASKKIRSRFEVLQRPSGTRDFMNLAQRLNQMTVDLEVRELSRIEQTLDVLCQAKGSAISPALSAYFGQGGDPPEAGGGQSPWRQGSGGAKGQMPDGLVPCSRAVFVRNGAEEDTALHERWAQVLQMLRTPAEPPIDDPYLLARFAAGIKSPKIVKLKLHKHQAFGCCSEHTFPKLLDLAEIAL